MSSAQQVGSPGNPHVFTYKDVLPAARDKDKEKAEMAKKVCQLCKKIIETSTSLIYHSSVGQDGHFFHVQCLFQNEIKKGKQKKDSKTGKIHSVVCPSCPPSEKSYIMKLISKCFNFLKYYFRAFCSVFTS